MTCSNRNIILNGDFYSRIAPWTGKQIQRVRNPQTPSDHSILMGNRTGSAQSILSQQRKVTLEKDCAYYLTFRLINVSPDHRPARFFATVAYLSASGKLIRSTPLLLTPPEANRFKPYFAIVPPPPRKAHQIKVVFWLQQGRVYLDMIRLVSRSV